MAAQTLEIRRPDDMHVHLREGRELEHYARDAARVFARVLVMPNTNPPITSVEELEAYREMIARAAPTLEPLLTFKIQEGQSREAVAALRRAGAIAGKYYPRGVTTNSEDGIAEIESVFPVLASMEAEGMVLCLHGEKPGAFSLAREEMFLPELERVASAFPSLRIVLEHVSTQAAVECVSRLRNGVAATVTVHHLLCTLDDLLGERLDPHLFCKPVVKGPADREAIRKVVLAGDPRFFFGSDSAPHQRATKEGRSAAAGVYSMPVSLPLLAAFFEEQGRLDRLEDFVSRFGAEFYGLPLNEGVLRLRRSAWRVPEEHHGVVPLYAGRELHWQLG